ncbi:MAG TPA: carbonic anhydrase, partial [Planctomycetaceae bacterium]|nr:carbonic anhydrase [Planctomycetaceae bacterium]
NVWRVCPGPRIAERLMDRLASAAYAGTMPREMPESQHFSPIPFDAHRIRAAAVYCSDGRFGEQIDDLLHKTLQLPRYDRLAIPGGAACLAGHFNAYREEEGVAEQLRFLLTVHEVRRVILVAHQDCAYYTQWLRISPLQLESRQREDLVRAIRRVKRFGIDLDVQAYFARRQGDRVSFERVDV